MPVAGAVVGAVATVGGSVLSAKSNKKAINKATDAQVQVAAQNNALAREIYGKNEGYLSPYVQRGNAAGTAINALLGLAPQMSTPGPATTQVPTGTTNGAGVPVSPNTYGNTFANGVMGRIIDARTLEDMPLPGVISGYGGGTFNADGSVATPVQQNVTTTAATTPALTPQQQQQNAFEAFRNSTGYQFRLGEGQDSINAGYAARGLLNSGAAQKALLKYGQDYASNEFGNYMGLLSNQQGVGLSGASALAGVGQNYVNNVTANNNQSADAISNGALMKARNNNNMWGGIANGLGSIFGGSSYFGG